MSTPEDDRSSPHLQGGPRGMEGRSVERLHAAFRERAAQVAVDHLAIGLGYTAVSLRDGGAGLAYTWPDDRSGCSHLRGWDDAEGSPASGLLDLLLSDGGLERTIGVATANALNHAAALVLPEDEGPAGSLVRELSIAAGTRVSMVGYFAPVARVLRELGAELDVVDDHKGMGDQEEFGKRLGEWSEVVVVTSTSLLGGTADDVLAAVDPRARVAFIGPTTPLVPEVFERTQVRLLGGMVPRDVPEVLRAVRHGAGTRKLQPYCRKVYCTVRPPSAGTGR